MSVTRSQTVATVPPPLSVTRSQTTPPSSYGGKGFLWMSVTPGRHTYINSYIHIHIYIHVYIHTYGPGRYRRSPDGTRPPDPATEADGHLPGLCRLLLPPALRLPPPGSEAPPASPRHGCRLLPRPAPQDQQLGTFLEPPAASLEEDQPGRWRADGCAIPSTWNISTNCDVQEFAWTGV